MSYQSLMIRSAKYSEIASIRAMQERSFRALGAAYYGPREIAAFIAEIGTMDDAVVAEGHYFVAVAGSGAIAGSGGWSQLPPTYANSQAPIQLPANVATVRSVFVEPSMARNGIGSAIMRRTEADALDNGIDLLRLTATLSGIPLYEALGYRLQKRHAIMLGGNLSFGCANMDKELTRRADAA